MKCTRPKTRLECIDGPRPCPWVSCRFHLYLDVNEKTGTIRFNFPDKEVWELKETCALDLAGEKENTYDEIGQALNLTRERVRQVVVETSERVHDQISPGEKREPLPESFDSPSRVR